MYRSIFVRMFVCLFASVFASHANAQGASIVTGKVTLEANGEPVHGAVALLVGLGSFTTTDHEGRFRIEKVPEGTYELLVQREHLSAERQPLTVAAEEIVEVNIKLALSPVHEHVTVTTSARRATTARESFNAVTVLDSFELAHNMWGTLGEVLENEPGIAKRSFGPGSSRPIIRGFDGDRVLIMQDGVRTADLSSQSGDHGTTIDPGNTERIEVVKGPATLLYGSNAIGGVVNTITSQDIFRQSQPQGVHGQVLANFGNTNDQAGTSGHLRYGNGKWMAWGGGGTRRTGDYDTPEGPVENSRTRFANASAGAGYYGDRTYFAVGYEFEDGDYGVPFAGDFHGGHEEEGEHAEEEVFISIEPRRQNVRVDFGMNELRNTILDELRVVFTLVDYAHDEVETIAGDSTVGTSFDNNVYLLRAEFEQNPVARLSGKFGVWTKNRDYNVIGEEALAPPTTQTAFAAFAYEELKLGPSAALQFGARFEHNNYNPAMRQESDHGHDEKDGEHEEEESEHDEGEGEHEEEENLDLEAPPAIPRTFTGVSGSIGIRYDLTSSAAFVANLTRSYRAPALEELYNFGLHVGNLAFEIGNPILDRESSLGVDLSLKTGSNDASGEVNFYYYDIDNFVFAAATDQEADGLRLSPFVQGDSRFVGFDAAGSVRLTDYLWVKASAGYTEAKLTAIDEFLPRIPSLHGRVQVEIPYKGLAVVPEVVFAGKQNKVALTETPTDGYTVLNINVNYTLARSHMAQIFSVRAYNLTNELHRNHTSFIKDFASQIGRGVKFTYSMRFF